MYLTTPRHFIIRLLPASFSPYSFFSNRFWPDFTSSIIYSGNCSTSFHSTDLEKIMLAGLGYKSDIVTYSLLFNMNSDEVI